jgi:hypothetical protein
MVSTLPASHVMDLIVLSLEGGRPVRPPRDGEFSGGCLPFALRWSPQGWERLLGIVVYWLESEGEAALPVCEFFSSKELTQALAWAENRRRHGHCHVSISTELADHVGQPGVAAVEAGRTPDGEAYEWSKAGRAGKLRRR